MICSSACSRGPDIEDNGIDISRIARSPSSFVGTDVALRGLPVFMTATYCGQDGSVLKQPTNGGWVCIVIVNPRRATQGLLACLRTGDAIEKISGQRSSRMRLQGPVKTFSKTDLVTYMKHEYGVNLIVTRKGEPLRMECAIPLSTPSALPASTKP